MLSNHPNVLGGGNASSMSPDIGNVDGPASSTDNAIVRWDGASGRLIQNSVNILSDAGDLTLPVTATAGLQLYNTADQVTNYERLEALWSSNLGLIQTTRGGTGNARNLRIRAVGSGITTGWVELSAVNTNVFSVVGPSTSNTGMQTMIVSGTSTATSGTLSTLVISPTYNQASGTAANTDLLINRTETAVGSGDQMSLEVQVGAVRRWSLGTRRVLTTDATVTTIATIPVPASTTLGVNGYVVARRTGGTGGTAEDGAYYCVETVYKNAAGTATNIGTTVTAIGESQAGWDVTVSQSGSDILIRVTGAADNNISWMGVFHRNPISS